MNEKHKKGEIVYYFVVQTCAEIHLYRGKIVGERTYSFGDEIKTRYIVKTFGMRGLQYMLDEEFFNTELEANEKIQAVRPILKVVNKIIDRDED